MFSIPLKDNDTYSVQRAKGFQQRHHYDVIKAYTVEKAEKRVNGKVPDWVVCDVALPSRNGLGFPQKRKAKDPFLPVVLTLMGGDSRHMLAEPKSGADDDILKPYSLGVFEPKFAAKLRTYYGND